MSTPNPSPRSVADLQTGPAIMQHSGRKGPGYSEQMPTGPFEVSSHLKELSGVIGAWLCMCDIP